MAPGGFGGANINDSGIRTNSIIYALNYLLGLPVNNTSKPGQTTRNIFSTFGALVGRSPMTGTPKSPTAESAAPTNTNMEIYHATSSNVPKAFNKQDSVTYGGTGAALSFPNSRLQQSSATGKPTTGTVGTFLELGDDGSVHRNSLPTADSGQQYSIFDFGLIPPDDASQTISGGVGTNTVVANQQYKQLYYIDLGELPVVPMQLRTDCSQIVMDFNSFITEVCDKSGVDFFWEMLYLKVYTNMPSIKIIKLRTVSRKVQPSDRKISDYIATLREQGVMLSSVSLGKEFNSAAKPRTMLIGAKQQRLFQAKNYTLAYKASNYIYHTTRKKFIHYDTFNDLTYNAYRIPDPGSIRDLLAIERQTSVTSPNEIKKADFYDIDTSWNKHSNNAFPAKGNYLKSVSSTTTITTGGDSPLVKGSSTPSIKNSDTFIRDIGKVLFDWAYTKFLDKSSTNANQSLNRDLHKQQNWWISSPASNDSGSSSGSSSGGGGGWSSGVGSVSVRGGTGSPGSAPTESTVLSNFADAIADIGYNVFKYNPNTHYFKNRLKYTFNDLAQFGWTRDDGAKRFIPIFYHSVCPFFGTVDFIDKTKTQYATVDKTKKPRPVWFDTWLNGLAIEFNVKELPITRLELEGIFNGGTFIVHETELRAALVGYDSWMGYLSTRIHDPHIKQMVKNAVCGNRVITPSPQPTPQASRRAGPTAPNSADVGAVANMNPGQGDNKPQQKDTKSDWQVTSDNDWDACAIFCALFKIETGLNQKTKSANAGASTPKNRNAGLQSALQDDLKTLHAFFRKIADEYYGKKFMVRLPMILSYKDRDAMINLDPRPTPTPAPNSANIGSTTAPSSSNPSQGSSNSSTTGGTSNPNAGTIPTAGFTYINIGTSDNPRYLTEGTGKIYSNYSISPEGAWEEYGNSIDDCIMVGAYTASPFTDDSGKIKPILGYPADDKFDHEAYFCCEWVRDNVCKLVTGPNVFYYYDILKRSNALSNANRYTAFTGGTRNGGAPCS
jgi:hypothetical protein